MITHFEPPPGPGAIGKRHPPEPEPEQEPEQESAAESEPEPEDSAEGWQWRDLAAVAPGGGDSCTFHLEPIRPD